jgi:hypothetical protein
MVEGRTEWCAGTRFRQSVGLDWERGHPCPRLEVILKLVFRGPVYQTKGYGEDN